MKKEQFCIIVTEDLKDKIKRCAEKKNISMTALVRLAVSEYIERNE